MRLRTITDFAEKVNVTTIGDIHTGSPDVNWKKLQDHIDWIHQTPHTYAIIMGDMFDVALLNSPTNPFTQEMPLNQAIQKTRKMLDPILFKIVGAITGNHERRLERLAGFNPLQNMCNFMGIPYLGYSAVFRFRVGQIHRNNVPDSTRQEYIFYVHHTTGNGRTLGSKLTKITKLRDLFEGADVYIGAHDHFQVNGNQMVGYLSKSGNGKATIKFKTLHFVDSGAFLKWNESYGEAGMYPPAPMGAPIITLSGTPQRKITVRYE